MTSRPLSACASGRSSWPGLRFRSNHPGNRRREREALVNGCGRSAVKPQPRRGTRALGRCAGRLRLRRVELLHRRDTRRKQFLDARQILLRQRVILLRLARLGLRHAEFGRGDHGERLPGAHHVAKPHADGQHPSAQRAEDAHRAVFIPHQAAVEPQHRFAAPLDLLGDQRGDLRTAGGKDHRLTLDVRLRRGGLLRGLVAAGKPRNRNEHQDFFHLSPGVSAVVRLARQAASAYA